MPPTVISAAKTVFMFKNTTVKKVKNKIIFNILNCIKITHNFHLIHPLLYLSKESPKNPMDFILILQYILIIETYAENSYEYIIYITSFFIKIQLFSIMYN